ncbi:hypothetical protein K8R66_02520 [bacterium]|nr:hypothetical protein [bacterium]
MRKKKFLFFFVHPAKFHLSRITINALKEKGHQVDIIITGRDILEELIINEGWDYTKIFPKGRKLKGMHVWLSAAIFSILTIVKLFKLTWGKKYDFFISDDFLSFIGRINGTKSIFVTDDDLRAVPESVILMIFAHYILAPDICDLGRYNQKKLGYYGYKSLFHLHPNHFKADISKINSELREKPYFFIRTVSATSTHDVGKRGIDDNALRKIIKTLEPHGRVVLNSERKLPPDLDEHVISFRKNDISHFIFYATLFISDSTTMCAEAAVLGIPAIEFDDWFADFKQYQELNQKYQLLYGFGIDEEVEMLEKINDLLKTKNLKETFQERRRNMLKEKIDASTFLIWILTGYPNSITDFFKHHSIQNQFN